MSDEAKKLTADEQSFWDACVIEAIKGLTKVRDDYGSWEDFASDAAQIADAMLAARRERGAR